MSVGGRLGRRALLALIGGWRTVLLAAASGVLCGSLGQLIAPLPNLRSSTAVATPLLSLLCVFPATVAVFAMDHVPPWWLVSARRNMSAILGASVLGLVLISASIAGVIAGAAVGFIVLRDATVLLGGASLVLCLGGRGSAVTVLLAASILGILLGQKSPDEQNILGIQLMPASDPRALGAFILALVVLGTVGPRLPSRRLSRDGQFG